MSSSSAVTTAPGPVTVAIAFAQMPHAASPQCSGRSGEPPVYTYYRCLAVAYASLRRFNPGADLVLVSSEPLPEPFAGQLERIGVELVVRPFEHRPPQGFGSGWEGSLFAIDAMAELRDRPGTLVLSDPDQLCVRPLDGLLEAAGTQVGVQTEKLEDQQKSGADKMGWYQELTAKLHRELGEESGGHRMWGGNFYSIPEGYLPVLHERMQLMFKACLARHERGEPRLWIDEHYLNYALRAVPVAELSAHVRSIPTAPWRRYLTDTETILSLSLWHLINEKDLGFQRMYRDAVDPGSWFWTAGDEEFRRWAGAIMSVTSRSPQRALLNACGDVVEKITTERMQHRLKPLYNRLVKATSRLRSV